MAHNAGADGDALVRTTLQICALVLKVKGPICLFHSPAVLVMALCASPCIYQSART